MSEEILKAENIWFKYSKKQDWVLKNINLSIRRGEFIALIGESGAGKTTLAKHFNGLLKPLKGRVEVLGMDTRRVPTSKLARHVGYVFQNPDSQIYSATIRDELSIGLKKLGFGESEIEERIKWALEVVDLKKPLNISPHILSFGERHRLAIATVLAIRPDIFVLDEPFAGIDYKRSLQLLGIFKELTKKGHSVVLIGHDLQLIAELATRVIFMSRGEIIREGKPEDVLGDIDFLVENNYIPLQITQASSILGLGRIIRVSDFVNEIVNKVRS
ncbi:energy-coupling factor ABC transporter ATP-binding protein [Thermogladius sp. 4427co]|uniref:energy-coupling factor ABC transporter ATP-binding protein n=1 Tax=Thermogladius sp. 4427co TaxID=3450718 RepID=UPI003F795137